MANTERDYEVAKERYAAIGVDVDRERPGRGHRFAVGVLPEQVMPPGLGQAVGAAGGARRKVTWPSVPLTATLSGAGRTRRA